MNRNYFRIKTDVPISQVNLGYIRNKCHFFVIYIWDNFYLGLSNKILSQDFWDISVIVRKFIWDIFIQTLSKP